MSMKRRLACALGAGILMMSAPTASLAYQPPVIPAVQQEGQGSYDNMIAALENASAEVEQLNAATDLVPTNVRLFDADFLASDRDPAALDQAVASHGEQIQFVQNTVASNEVVRSVLQMVNLPVESIVAIDTLEGGDVAIYFNL